MAQKQQVQLMEELVLARFIYKHFGQGKNLKI